MQRLDQERVRAQGRGDPAAEVGRVRQGGGQVVRDVVPPAEEQRDEDRLAAQFGEGVGEQRPVQLDVAEADGQAGAERTDPVKQRADGARGPRVPAAVGHGDQGRSGVRARGGGHTVLQGGVPDGGGLPPVGPLPRGAPVAVQPDLAELVAQLGRDLGGEVGRAQGNGAVGVVGIVVVAGVGVVGGRAAVRNGAALVCCAAPALCRVGPRCEVVVRCEVDRGLGGLVRSRRRHGQSVAAVRCGAVSGRRIPCAVRPPPAGRALGDRCPVAETARDSCV